MVGDRLAFDQRNRWNIDGADDDARGNVHRGDQQPLSGSADTLCDIEIRRPAPDNDGFG